MSGPYGRLAYVEGLCPQDGLVQPLWGGGVVIRPVPGCGFVDAATAYPMGGFAAAADIETGLSGLRDAGAIALAVVADPLNPPDEARLSAHESVRVRLKTHYVVDFAVGPFAPTRHHRYEIRRARRRCAVERVDLSREMARWVALYDTLGRRHGIEEQARLGGAQFEALAADPQAVVFAARVEGEIEAMSIWLSDGEVAHNHLGASSPSGYAASCSYALYAAAIETFERHRCLDLGGNPGLQDDPGHGLARFKRGFSNAERATFLSGVVLDGDAYKAAGKAAGVSAGEETGSGFFPAYRAPARRVS